MRGRKRYTHAAGTVAATAAVALALGAAPSCTTMSDYSVSPHEYSGVRLYQVYCSSCHGLTGRGDGPVEPLLRGGAPDLTRIAERRGEKFPGDEIRSIVDGRNALAAHGTRDMPVWGFEFHAGASDDELARRQRDRTINRLVGYLETIQPGYYR
jgi:mono/diheme cytochrome c family protein